MTPVPATAPARGPRRRHAGTHLFLAAMALGVIAVAIAIPLLPGVGRWLGFVAPPPLFFVFLIGATLAYLAIVEITKRVFYRVVAGQSPRSRSLG